MWIKREVFERLIVERTAVETQARVVSEQNRVLQTNMDWMRTRINQLEQERAAFLYEKTGIKIQVPEIQYQPHQATKNYTAMPNFEDVGEEEAARLGISYYEDGTLRYES